MPPQLPPRFVGVDTARASQGYYNVIGVVIDCLPKRRTSGSSVAVTFTIHDVNYGPENPSWNGLKIKYFSDHEHRLPDVRVNDVILLRHLKVCSRNHLSEVQSG